MCYSGMKHYAVQSAFSQCCIIMSIEIDKEKIL